MKKKYIQPNVSVSFVVVGSLLLGQSQYEGIEFGPGGIGGGLSKEHDFSSWDYGFATTHYYKDISLPSSSRFFSVMP